MSLKKPLILIDAFGIDQPGGPRTAVFYLFEKLFEIRPHWRFVIFLSQPEPIYKRFQNVRQVILPFRKGILARLFVQLSFPLLALILRADLVHFAKSQGAWMVGVKTVMTLFDVTTLYHPKLHSPLAVWYSKVVLPALARRCNVIVTISKNAAEDIHQWMKVPQQKIRVIYCASQFDGTSELDVIPYNVLQARHHLPDRYLLFVGILALKKNLKTLIQALSVLRDENIDFPKLVMAGPHYPLSEDREIFTTIKDLHLEDLTQYIGKVSKEDLAALYQHAEIVILPSIHEGFGIPVLEAMGFNVPVIASKSSSMPEIVGDAGLLVDDFLSPQAWARQIEILLKDPALRENLVKAGQLRSKLFNWQSSANELANLYQSLFSTTKK
jgi:glycosyltransferase involved in cell wall biosynthesis